MVILYWVGVVLVLEMEYLFFDCLLKPTSQSVELSRLKSSRKNCIAIPL